jgi:hypothetical protein
MRIESVRTSLNHVLHIERDNIPEHLTTPYIVNNCEARSVAGALLFQPTSTVIMTEQEAAASVSNSTDDVPLTLTHHGKPITFTFPKDATLQDLSDRVATELSIPPGNQKFLVAKLGLQKPPFKDASLPVSELASKKITLLGSTAAEVSTLGANIAAASKPRSPGPVKAATPSRTRDWKRVQEEAQYTFHTLRPLPYLPNPDRSLRFLERLRDDAGIKAAMRTHKFSVPLLTEMDPAMHTTHESRTLGLNRNQGEVIELRLRTDAYDGYRDYKTIRKTLCHELAHNVWGPHDRNFWNLCRQIEEEVARNDWRSGGHSVGNEEYYEPSEEEVYDHGGWTGGEFVLGGGGGAEDRLVSSAGGSVSAGNLSRRDILARAAEERMRKSKQAEQQQQADKRGDLDRSSAQPQ